MFGNAQDNEKRVLLLIWGYQKQMQDKIIYFSEKFYSNNNGTKYIHFLCKIILQCRHLLFLNAHIDYKSSVKSKYIRIKPKAFLTNFNKRIY